MNTWNLIGQCFDCDEWVGDSLPFKGISGNLFLNKMCTLRIKRQFSSFGSFLYLFILEIIWYRSYVVWTKWPRSNLRFGFSVAYMLFFSFLHISTVLNTHSNFVMSLQHSTLFMHCALTAKIKSTKQCSTFLVVVSVMCFLQDNTKEPALRKKTACFTSDFVSFVESI